MTEIPQRFGDLNQAASQASQGTMYGGAATTGVAWAMNANVLIAVLGLVIAFAGFCLNVYFRLRADRRQGELHELQLKKLSHIEDELSQKEGE